MHDNCGLPDGVVHAHTERCYQAGYAAGRAATISEVRDLVSACLTVIRPTITSIHQAARRMGLIDQ